METSVCVVPKKLLSSTLSLKWLVHEMSALNAVLKCSRFKLIFCLTVKLPTESVLFCVIVPDHLNKGLESLDVLCLKLSSSLPELNVMFILSYLHMLSSRCRHLI